MLNSPPNVLVTGGAGYVGAVLVPKLIRHGYHVKVYDLMIYGRDVFEEGDWDRSQLDLIQGDIRDQACLQKALHGVQIVIHLACISNDPSFDLDPKLGKSINLDTFRPLVELSRAARVERFVFASSSSVYGVKDEEHIREEMKLEPLTDYSRFKAKCEQILAEYQTDEFTTVTLRPATVCGYSPRQRLDVIVNILTNLAYHKREISVFGGKQKRPNIHIEDLTDLYVKLLDLPREKIAGKVYNAGAENHTVNELGCIVKEVIGPDVTIKTTPTDDLRSYHISSEKIREEIGFVAQRTVHGAVAEMKQAFESGRLQRTLDDNRYFNVRKMQEIGLR